MAQERLKGDVTTRFASSTESSASPQYDQLHSSDAYGADKLTMSENRGSDNAACTCSERILYVNISRLGMTLLLNEMPEKG